MIESLSAVSRQAWELASGIPPWQLGLALAVLPLVGVPAIPLLVLTGVRAGPFQGLVIAWIGLATNMLLAHRLSRGWLRPILASFLQRRGYRLPQVDAGDATRLVVLTRVVPGLPLVAQNYLLGLAGVGFWRYWLLSVPLQGLYASGFVLLGKSLVETSAWKFVTAAGLLVAVGLGVSLLRRRLQRGTPSASDPGPLAKTNGGAAPEKPVAPAVPAP